MCELAIKNYPQSYINFYAIFVFKGLWVVLLDFIKRRQMSQKNPISNFTSAYDEILAFLSNFGENWCASNDGAKFIEQNLTFIGSKPVL